VDTPGSIAVHDDRIVVGGTVGSTTPGDTADPPCLEHQEVVPRPFVFEANQINGAVNSQVCAMWSATQTAALTGVWASSARIVAAGYTTGVTTLGCGAMEGGPGSPVNGWYRNSTAASSTCTDSLFLPGMTQVFATRVAGVMNDTVLGGSFNGALGNVSSQGQDAFLARYQPGVAAATWIVKLDSDGSDLLGDLAVSPKDGTLIAVGSCAGNNFLGKANCDAAGDGFIVRVTP
jgi:hypothetical protein